MFSEKGETRLRVCEWPGITLIFANFLTWIRENLCNSCFSKKVIPIVILAIFSQTLFANPFDRRRLVALDELCLDGDLNLSLPLARVKLDEKTTLEIRVEHEMRTGDYGNARSEMVVRPLFTNVVPYDRQHLIWNKPNGEKTVLVSQKKNAAAVAMDKWPETARAFLNEGIGRHFTSSRAVAYGDRQGSHVVISSEDYWLGYKDGSLSWFILPSGKLVNVQGRGSFISALTIDGEQFLRSSFSTEAPDEIRIRTKDAALYIDFDTSSRLSAVRNAGRIMRLKCEYGQTGLLSAVATGNTTTRYAWQETRQGMPRFMEWMKPWRLRSVNEKHFGYTHDYDYIKMQVESPRSGLLVKFRYGQIVSMKRK